MEGRLGASITMWVPESMIDGHHFDVGTISVGHLCEEGGFEEAQGNQNRV